MGAGGARARKWSQQTWGGVLAMKLQGLSGEMKHCLLGAEGGGAEGGSEGGGSGGG